MPYRLAAVVFCLLGLLVGAGAALANDRAPSLPPGSGSLTSTLRTLIDAPRQPSFSLAGSAPRDEEFGREDRDRVNVTRAAALSLLLPGGGQWIAGAKQRAGAFLAAEAAAWTAFAYFRTVKGIKEDTYQTYARVHAGIDPSGKGDDFYRTITFYDSRTQFNELGRLLAPDRPYYPDTPLWDWQWDSPASMHHYRILRNQSSEAANRAKFALGAVIINHVVATIDAWRTAKSVNRRARMEASHWQIHFKGRPRLDHPGILVMISKRL